jgi:biotin carboxyl carrier protein
MGNFALKVRRDVEGAAAAPAPAAPSPVADMGVRAPLPAMAAAAPASGYASVDGSELSSDEGSARADSSDESAVYVVSPKVGIFRRGKYAAGKRIGKALCVEGVGATLKRGQTVGYVEQLGTYVPVDAPQAGEVLSILDEGAPVEYQQEVVKLAPFFGGHIIGEAKYA